MRISVKSLETFCVEALTRVGVSPGDAQTTARVLVTTDTWGVQTHGTKLLRSYVRRLQGGGLCRDAVPRVEREGPAWAVVDGQSALGMVTSTFAMRTAIAKARQAGLAYVGARNSCHIGAAGYYAAMALEQDMIGLAMANDTPTVTGPGAVGHVLGSNPFAFAAPAAPHPPILLDMATSTVAGGKVFAAAFYRKPVPGAWLMDLQGRPTPDATLFPHAATLTPMGGYKGYGLAFMIETLSSVLTGAAMTHHVLSWLFADSSKPTGHGAAFIALDVAALMPVDQFRQRMNQMIDEIHALPRAEGVDRICVPGEAEWEKRAQALAAGFDLAEDVTANLRALAAELRLEFPPRAV